MENLGRDFDVFRDHLYQISEDLTGEIKEYYPDQDKIVSSLEEVSARKNVKITIYDVNGNKLFTADKRRGYGLSLELKNFIVVNRNLIYVVELVYPFSITNFGELSSIKKIRDSALILLGLLIILLMFYLHFSLVRPLTTLNRGVETVNYGSSGMIIPIAGRKDELGELTRKFQDMQQRLNASYRQQAEMMASISHDLKTPLTSILGFLERLMGRELPADKQREYHQIIFKKARDIQEMITEFNDYVTADFDSSITDNRENVNVKDFFAMITNEYASELGERGIIFEQIFDDNGLEDQPFIKIDIRKIKRIFANLVNNSLKYADKLTKITFKCELKKNMVSFTIEDDGPGVPPNELTAIFEMFYRVEKSRSREKGGSGLGLAICRKIIEAHEGTIKAYSPVSGGLGITFSLPISGA